MTKENSRMPKAGKDPERIQQQHNLAVEQIQ